MKRHGFVTFWLISMLCFGAYSIYDSFSDSTVFIYNLMRLFRLISDSGILYIRIQGILYVIAVILLLSWQKIGFWLIIVTDIIGIFILSNTGGGFALLLVLYAIKNMFLFGILNIRKDGISTWDYLSSNTKNYSYTANATPSAKIGGPGIVLLIIVIVLAFGIGYRYLIDRPSGLNQPRNTVMNSSASSNFAYVSSDALNVRSGPSANHAIVGRLSRNTRVEVISRSGTWWRIRSGNIEGYVNSQYLRN